MEHIYLVFKHNNKIENSSLLKLISVSSVNEPISVGIEPVRSFSSILGDKIIGTKLDT